MPARWKPLHFSMLVFRGLCGTGLSFRGFIVAPRLTTAGKPEGALESAEVRDKVLGRKNGLRVPLCSAGAHRSGCHRKFTTKLCKMGDFVWVPNSVVWMVGVYAFVVFAELKASNLAVFRLCSTSGRLRVA